VRKGIAMKNDFKKPLTFLCMMCLLVLAASVPARAEALQTLNIDETTTIDPIGNADIVIKFKLTASQFEDWQSKYGQNSSLLKRDLSKYVSQYDTSDWDVQEKQMDREVTVSLKARGLLKYHGDGEFEFKIPKAWRGGDRSNNVYNFNYVDVGRGGITQHSEKVILPEGATNFRDDTSEDGDKVIKYTLAPATAGGGWMLWLGILALLGGAAIGASGFLVKPANQSVVKVTTGNLMPPS
jgi:hypothetical protein